MPEDVSFVFGPIPSRRLGQSLGINHVPVKSCTYDCVYCQVGRTTKHSAMRQAFYDPDQVVRAVKAHVSHCRSSGIRIDYLTFVPDGEPTLDLHLGRMIRDLKPLGIPVAVFTNASLLWEPQVREDLYAADLVSIKCDAVNAATWRKLNRPAAGLSLDRILEGALQFSRDFHNTLITETMLIRHINDDLATLQAIAAVLATWDPDKVFIGVTTRPPTEAWAGIPEEANLLEAWTTFKGAHLDVELLTGYSPAAFQLTGDAAQDILNITCVHPVRREEVLQLLRQAGAGFDVIESLVKQGKLKKVRYRDQDFYMRRLIKQAS